MGIAAELGARMGRGRAAIQLLSKGDFAGRLADMEAGRAPREFLYGFPHLVERGYDVRFQRSDGPYSGLVGRFAHRRERLLSRLTGLSRRHHVLEELAPDWFGASLALSFTDHFSLTLGQVMKGLLVRPYAIGIFHGLSDIEGRTTALGRRFAHGYIWRALAGLDHVAFLGPADRTEAIARYGIAPHRSSVFPFGVDTDFWCPGDEPPADRPFVLAVGSDPSRDYATLVAAPVRAAVRILTRLPVPLAGDRRNVEVIGGDYFSGPVDDLALRRLYRQAAVVVLPLRDVFQPTGQSVCLQAMACGAPVVLSRIRGLWAPDLYVDGEHVLLVPPADPAALGEAVNRLLDDRALAARLGAAGGALTRAHHGLETMNRGLENLVCLAPGIQRR